MMGRGKRNKGVLLHLERLEHEDRLAHVAVRVLSNEPSCIVRNSEALALPHVI